MPAHQHGKEMVTVKVGSGKQYQEFVVHKTPASALSKYFSSALNSGFKEASENIITLKDHHPVAFAVWYHYLYSGQVSADATFFMQSQTTEDVFWLRTLKLADFTMVHPLLVIAYERLRILFGSNQRNVPSIDFIDELYDDSPQEKIQQYIVAHTVFWIQQTSSGDWKEWKNLIERQTEFGVAVAVHYAKVRSDIYQGDKSHPASDQALVADVLFPEPKNETKEEGGGDAEGAEGAEDENTE